MRILDVGCGSGIELIRFIVRGAHPADCFGIDIDTNRVAHARALHPHVNVVVGNAAQLPWPDSNFDLVSQFTTFTSIPDANQRTRAAEEIRRVLRPGGHLVWYDFWINPINPVTSPISAKEVRGMFPDFVGTIRRVTLAPPLARRIAPHSWFAAALLQELFPLQTHCLGVLTKRG
jgi:ubiquinone/menaquinone biosynthesis C-methylase UbiE